MKKIALLMMMAVVVSSATMGQEKRYGIESAIVKKKTVMKAQGMEQTMSAVQYFADFGRKESVEMTMSMQGQTFTVLTMIKDGYIYSANMAVRQGTKINMANMDDLQTVNFLELTDEVKKKYQIQANGVQQVAGKDCNRYELSFTAQGQNVKGTVWVWQGITLKSNMNISGNQVEEEATELQEGAAISADKFELPEGVNFTEMKP
jgi:Cft2 family RNA processing exonuclease